jgi:hypothetical protein
MKKVHGLLLIAAALCLGACGSATRTVSVERDTTTVTQQTAQPAATHTTTVVQPPVATTTVIQASTPASPTQSVFRACDQNISASHDASCELAENVFYELWEQHHAEPVANSDDTVTAYSPVSHEDFTFQCNAGSDTVECVSDTDATDEVTFSIAAFDRYTPSDAAAYASSHEVG